MAATGSNLTVFGSSLRKWQNNRYYRRSHFLFTSLHLFKVERGCGAKSANERQKTPSNKACYTKTEIVIFHTIQQSAKKFHHH
jgi:hypothetical protein